MTSQPLPVDGASVSNSEDTSAASGANDSGLGQMATPRGTQQEADTRKRLDPNEDGWKSEAFNDAAGGQLKRIGKLLAHPSKISQSDVSELADSKFACDSLRPEPLEKVFEDGAIAVFRAAGNAAERKNSQNRHKGAAGLAEALKSLVQWTSEDNDARTKFKIIGVDLAGEVATTSAYFEASGKTAKGTVQQNATWRCRWTMPEAGKAPQLRAIEVSDFEEVQVTSKHPKLFADCTQAVLGKNPSLQSQLGFSLEHWAARVEKSLGMLLYARYGVAVGDVNGDGWDDLYVCQPAGLPNKLFVHETDGTATDRSKAAGVDWLDQTSSALFVDLDNDGDQDLVVGAKSGVVVMDNDGSGKFQRRVTLPTAGWDIHALSAVDANGDGKLDLYITTAFAPSMSSSSGPRLTFLYHDANDGGANALFRNELGDSSETQWKFTDVTRAVGLDENNRRHSLASGWEDYDNDGDLDLYVANDYGQNCLYRNDDGKFTDVAQEAGVVDFGSGMSVSWGDYNRDGKMDLYVGNMFSSAGHRITQQEEFMTQADDATRAIYRRFAKGNTLFQNQGDGNFHDVGAEAAVEMGRWAWSSLFTDLNNDGWEDLIVANGFITTEDNKDL